MRPHAAALHFRQKARQNHPARVLHRLDPRSHPRRIICCYHRVRPRPQTLLERLDRLRPDVVQRAREQPSQSDEGGPPSGCILRRGIEYEGRGSFGGDPSRNAPQLPDTDQARRVRSGDSFDAEDDVEGRTVHTRYAVRSEIGVDIVAVAASAPEKRPGPESDDDAGRGTPECAAAPRGVIIDCGMQTLVLSEGGALLRPAWRRRPSEQRFDSEERAVPRVPIGASSSPVALEQI
mmetsp:Transcript_52145/g.156514  ORF Transcript_52145/g.156514 Transcript_52145/m.156514 type:complete len:235 (-) Transcript_52145:1411-2115(-)